MADENNLNIAPQPRPGAEADFHYEPLTPPEQVEPPTISQLAGAETPKRALAESAPPQSGAGAKQDAKAEKKRARAEAKTSRAAAPSPPKKKHKTKEETEQARQKKEAQARVSRRRNRQLIGLALTVLILIGAFNIVRSGIDLVKNLLDSEEERNAYQQRFEPLVWFDILPFSSVSQVDENSIKQVAIWGVLNQSQDLLERNEYGEALIPASMVDQYAAGIFGPEFRFSGHESFTDPEQGLYYNFDETTRMYNAPVTSLQPNYLASVVEIRREGGGVRRVVMGYVSTRTSEDQMIATPDYEHPARYVDFMLRRDGGSFYLYAIERNTTHTAQQAQSSSIAESVPLAENLIPPASEPASEPPPAQDQGR